jgi:tetratricopeptide (TPR) repeat protein
MTDIKHPSFEITRPNGIWCGVIGLSVFCFAASASAAVRNPREAYNQGVAKMQGNELRDAESALLDAAKSNTDAVQPVALYNLGHVRFLQGKETLKGERGRDYLLNSAEAAASVAHEAIRHAEAVADNDEVQALIGAYMLARNARKQLRQVRDETTRELDLLGSAFARWRRAVGDFRGAHELDAANTDAAFNADVVERHIEELLKFKKKMEEQGQQTAEMREKLRELMKKMRGKIPKEMQRESDDEEGDEDEDEEQEPQKPGDKPPKQQTQRIGGDREIDPDMLRVLKEKVQNRTMSVGQEGERPGDRGEQRGFRPDGQRPGEPRGRKGKDW